MTHMHILMGRSSVNLKWNAAHNRMCLKLDLLLVALFRKFVRYCGGRILLKEVDHQEQTWPSFSSYQLLTDDTVDQMSPAWATIFSTAIYCKK